MGQYLNSYSQLASGVPADNLTILGLAKKFASQIHHEPVPAEQSARASWARSARTKLSNIVHYQPVTVEHPWYVANTNHSTIESVSFRFTMSNGLSATGAWAKSVWTPEGAPMTIIIDDAGRKGADQAVWDNYPEVANRIDRGGQVLVLSILFTGDANPAERNVGSFGYMMSAVGAPPLGLEAAQLIGITKWAEQRWHPPSIRLESSGYRMQVVSLVAGALEPNLFKNITVHNGMRSLNYILEKPVLSNRVPDMFCLDFYKDFDLDMLKAMAEPARVTETDYVKLVPAKQ